MPRKIDHQERIELIMTKALDVFASNGYKDTTLSLIAQECNLARTTVYEYFKSTDEILECAVKTTSGRMLEKYQNDPKWNDIGLIVDDILETVKLHKNEISNLIRSLESTKLNLHDVILRRTAKLRLFLCRLIRERINSGAYKKVNSELVVKKLLVMLEAYCLELTLFGEEEASNIRDLINLCLGDYLYLQPRKGQKQ